MKNSEYEETEERMPGQSDEFRDFRKYYGFVIELFE